MFVFIFVVVVVQGCGLGALCGKGDDQVKPPLQDGKTI